MWHGLDNSQNVRKYMPFVQHIRLNFLSFFIQNFILIFTSVKRSECACKKLQTIKDLKIRAEISIQQISFT